MAVGSRTQTTNVAMAAPVASSSPNYSDEQIAKLFDQAREDFERETQRKISFPRHFDTVDQFVEQISKEKSAFGSFREHEHPNFFRHIRNALMPINILAQAFAGPSSNAFFASGVVLNAASFLIDAADGVSLSYDTVELLFEKIEDVSVEMDVLSRHVLPNELRDKVVELLIAVIRICSLSRKLAKQGRFLEYAKGLIGKDPAVTEQLAVFDRLRASLSVRVQSLSYNTVLSTRQDAITIKATLLQQTEKEEAFREELRAKFDSEKAMRVEDIKEQQAERIRDVLQPTVKNRVIHNSLKASRAKQSGSWIIEDGLFQSWAQRSFPILWLSGGPGIGKSSLTSFIVEFLKQQSYEPMSGAPRISTTYFYFKEADRELRSFTTALRTMACDTADEDPLFFKHVYKVCSESPLAMQNASLLWENVFLSYFGQRNCQNAAYLIFDGLDEVIETELEDFLRMLPILQHEGTGRLSVLLVGRPEMALHLTPTFGGIPPEIRVSAATNNDDIALFVKESLPKLPHYKQISPALRNDIRQALISKAGGMFLWVQLMLKELQPYYKSKNIRPILTQAPASISDMIHNILARFDRTLKGDDLFDFNELLVWTTWAKRPMSIGELQILVKLSGEEGENIYLEQALREQFSSFFDITSSAHRADNDVLLDPEPQSAKMKKVKLSLRAETKSDNGSSTSSDLDDDSEDDDDDKRYAAKVNFNHTSIRQYFQAGINTKVGVAGIDALASKAHVVRMLLKSIVDWKHWSGHNDRSGSGASDHETDARGCADVSDHDGESQTDQSESSVGASDTTSNSDDDESSADALIAYAASNWYIHLAALDPLALGLEDQSAIALLLVRLFRDREVIWIWIKDVEDFSLKWLETRENVQLVIRWLQRFVQVGHLTGEDADWVGSLGIGSMEALLAVIMDELAKGWLENEDSTWSGSTVFEYLSTYVKQIEAQAAMAPTDEATAIPDRESSADAVRRIARRFRPIETSIWHARVAWVMRRLQEPVEAMKEIELAIEAGAESWRFLMIKAKILASQYKWQEAIDTMIRSNKLLESDSAQMKENSDDYWENKLFVAEWLRDLGQTDKSLEYYRACYEHDPDDYDLLPPMLEIPREKGDHDRAMKFLRELNEAKTPKSGHSRLVHAILALKDEESFHFDIVDTTRRNQALGIAQTAYSDALSIAISKNRVGQRAWMQYYQGLLYERYLYQRDDAQDVWERIMRDSSKAIQGTALFKVRNNVIRDLCNLYIDKTIQVERSSRVAETYRQKVKNISTGNTSLLWHYDTETALGVLYRLMGEDEKAKRCFRVRIKRGFDLLTDKDPENDYAAYYIIAQEALALAGPEHQKDCLAAYSLLAIHEKTVEAIAHGTEIASKAQTETKFWPLKDGTEVVGVEPKHPHSGLKEPAGGAEKAAENVAQEKLPRRRPTLTTFLPSQTKEFATTDTISDWLFASCDGCDKELNIPDNSYVCTLCLDMNFCADCQVKLKNDTLGFRICNPKHELLYIPKAPGPLPKDMVRYDNEYVPILDWLGRLQEAWGN